MAASEDADSPPAATHEDRGYSSRSEDGAQNQDTQRQEGKARSRRGLILFGSVVAAGAVIALLYWLIFARGRESTDDAYTEGRVVTIAPKVSGYVKTLAVDDNQPVKAGDLLLQIDPADYEVALANARATVAQVQAQIDAARANFAVSKTSDRSDVVSAEAVLAQAQANEVRAKADLERQLKVDPRATTQQQIDQIRAQERVQQRQVRDAQARLRTARRGPDRTKAAAAQVQQFEAQLLAAQAQERQAELNLGYTELRAPLDGRVARRSVERGTLVQAGQALLAVVANEVWIVANFKENQLADMHPGQPVAIGVDAYPALQLHGHVDSLQMGSGARFSVFPAENATGNFVKIVQRFPVKIVIDSGLDPNLPLPLGASVEPTVDLR